jgi:hypothetical protein
VDLAIHRRMLMLRECTVHFAPYGFRATWHHLVVSAAIPQHLEDDPDALVRAVGELEEARDIWTSHLNEFAARRAEEKARGQRTLHKTDQWHHWGNHRLAYCPDPGLHPRDRLATVVGRLISAYSSGQDYSKSCPLCGHLRWQQPCPQCGIELRGHLALPPQDIRAKIPLRWREIWQRVSASQSLIDREGFPSNKIAALRLAQRLVAEVPSTQPGRRAFVDIVPSTTVSDREALRASWTRRDANRAFKLSHWEYDEKLLSTSDYDVDAVLIRTATADNEAALPGVLANWSLQPVQFQYPWDTADPR